MFMNNYRWRRSNSLLSTHIYTFCALIIFSLENKYFNRYIYIYSGRHQVIYHLMTTAYARNMQHIVRNKKSKLFKHEYVKLFVLLKYTIEAMR
jgi:hypothetical protein